MDSTWNGPEAPSAARTSDGEVCHCSTRLPGAPRRQRSSAPWRACSSASALCANSIAFRVVLAQRLHGLESREPLLPSRPLTDSFRCYKAEPKRLEARTIQNQQALRPPATASNVIPNGEGNATFPLRSRCDDHGHDSRRSGHDIGRGSEDRTVRVPSRRLRSEMSKFISKPSAPAASSPVIPPHLRPDKTHKSNLSYMKTIHTSLQRERIKKFSSECYTGCECDGKMDVWCPIR